MKEVNITSDNVVEYFKGLHEDYLSTSNAQNTFTSQSRRHLLSELRKQSLPSEKEILKLDFLDKSELERFLSEINLRMFQTDHSLTEAQSDQYVDSFNKNSSIVPHIFSVLITAPGQHYLKHIDGESGKGWILPINFNATKIQVTHLGAKTDFNTPSVRSSADAVNAHFFYNFTPQISGWWDLSTAIRFQGYYLLKSNSSEFVRKSSLVEAKVTITVFQDSTMSKTFTVFERKGDTIEEYGFYNSTEFLNFETILRENIEACVVISISIQASALGVGSYADFNFLHDDYHFISPLVFTAHPKHNFHYKENDEKSIN